GPLRSVTLAHRLREAAAPTLVVLAASAGPEVGEEVDRLWAAGKPDEAFFLDRLGAAVTERLGFLAGRTLCPAAAPQGQAPLPARRPGGRRRGPGRPAHALEGALRGRCRGGGPPAAPVLGGPSPPPRRARGDGRHAARGERRRLAPDPRGPLPRLRPLAVRV